VEACAACGFDFIYVVTHADYGRMQECTPTSRNGIEGGKNARFVFLGLSAMMKDHPETDFVLIRGARPYVTAKSFRAPRPYHQRWVLQ
jgi:hypothetical protein